MVQIAITKRSVDAAKAGARDHFLWDDEVAGFGLKVTPAGSKVYVYQYRIARPGAAERTSPRRYTIGRHGSLTPDQARKRAKELAAVVTQGGDPLQRELDAFAAADDAARRAAEQARLEGELAFEKIAGVWLDHYENERDRRPSSVRLAKLVVNNHLTPKLKGKPIPHIGRDELQPVLDAIPVSQRGMRRAVFAYASVLFSWAHKRGYIQENPLLGMTKPEAPKARDRVLSDDELLAVCKAVDTLGDPFEAFFQLLLLTGQRRSEVAGISWDELDRVNATWTIPAGRAKNGVIHIVPISSEVIKVLDRLALAVQKKAKAEQPNPERWPEFGFILTTTGKTPISGITKAKKAVDTAVNKARNGKSLAPWRIHDLRRTIATGFQRLGIRFEVTEAVLNHVSGSKAGVAGIYQRHDWKDEKRSALNAWARFLSGLGESHERQVVVRMKSEK